MAPPYPVGGPAGQVAIAMRRTSGLAVASLVLGIVGAVACFLVVPSILAVIFGAVSLNQMKKEPTALTGRGLAIAGLVLGIVMLVVSVLVLAFGNVNYSLGLAPK